MGAVSLQILTIWLAVMWVYRLAASRDGRSPIDDLGVFWSGIFALYATIPPATWILFGGEYSPLHGRLFLLQPTLAEVKSLLNVALAYIISFSAVYAQSVKSVPSPNVQTYISNRKMAAAIVIVVSAAVIGMLIGGMGFLRSAESYGDSYKVIAELPLVLRQIIRFIGGISSVASIVFLIAVLQRWPRYKWLFGVYVFSLIVSVNPYGSRAATAIGLLGCVIAWHVLVKPISSGKLFVGGVVSLLLFLILGVLRGIGPAFGISDIEMGAIGAGEFDSLWANAVELLQAKQNMGIDVPFATRFHELFSFIPSQMLWFEKLSLSDWYLDAFHPEYKEAGGGLVFGAISQAVIGNGVMEAIIRGAVLAGVMGWVMRWVRRRSNSWWAFPIHLYLLVWTFQGVRDTTFCQWGGIVQTVIPAFIAISMIGQFFRKRMENEFLHRNLGR